MVMDQDSGVRKDNEDSQKLVLGIDIGDGSSCVAMYNAAVGNSEIIDFSGGYGRASVPTVLQFCPESDEWVFGESAVMNIGGGDEVNIWGLASALERGEDVEVSGVCYSAVELIGRFIKEILSMTCYINPNAEISGIVVSCNDYMSQSAKSRLSEAIGYAGQDNKIVSYKTDSECILTKILCEEGLANGKAVILDYGSRGFRIRIFNIEVISGSIKATVLYSKFDRNLSLADVENDVSEAVIGYYCDETGSKRENLSREIKTHLKHLSRSHRDLFFQKGKKEKPVQLYYNFAHPPFRKAVTLEISEQLIDKHKRRLDSLLDKLINYGEISLVICVGSGFEMPWAKEVVNERFKECSVICPKAPKNVQVSGAALISASILNICEAKSIEVIDPFKAIGNFGILIKCDYSARFLPLIEKGMHISSETKKHIVIIEESTENPVCIDIYSGSSRGKELELIESILVQGLPVRPKRVTKLGIRFNLLNQIELEVSLTDEGFGEIFPKTDYTYRELIKLCQR